MVTYSDMVTLLLTFFVMLLAMANFEDLTRLNAVLESIRTALSMGNYSTELSNDEKGTDPMASTPEANDHINPLVSRVREALEAHLSDDLVRMTRNQTEIRVEIDERVLFAPNQTRVHPAAYALIGDLARALADEEVTIIAEGHTDTTGSVEENWLLSVKRAVSVIVALEKQGPIPGERLEARGFSCYRPSDTVTDRASSWNRRVEIIIEADSRSSYTALDTLMGLKGGDHGSE